MTNGHGDDAYRFGEIKANFSSNVPGGVDNSALKAHLKANLQVIDHYPEPEPYRLEAELAALHAIEALNLIATNGATEAIYLIARSFAGSHSLILQPTFSEYADGCTLAGHRVTSIFALPGEAQGYKLPQECNMLWLCNPNNPSGSVCNIGHLRRIIESNPDVIFVFDQSYESFTSQTVMEAKEGVTYNNLIIIHSMTKRYAIPGLRLGYITSPSQLAQRIREQRMPWSVNALAIEAGLFIAKNPLTGKINMDECRSEARRLAQALEESGKISVQQSTTHYMLCHLNSGSAASLKEYLAREHQILIRDASNFEGLDEGHFRIAAQTHSENNSLISAIKEWLLIKDR